ncbi:GNAT family N-acetyltransferase [Shewanella sp. KX20019]|uniref:GNAT family N-acetyltransferase n=1 Tax=Shewanella sp. KX20019 TaxID=2803864 RepID=UPI001927C7EC|nr:GNAT family protein [Shewanella sp. KX20019]QQX81813.1 GNAT family N-acetyltransferase [Shewanella sp. KX20019]
MHIYGNKVLLRAMEAEDMEMLRAMVNSPEIEHLIGGYSFPVSKEQQLDWFNNVKSNNSSLRLIIETEENGAIGFANITDIDWKYRSATHGIKIADFKDRKKGIGTDVVMAVMRYAFDELQLNRLETTIVSYNKASLNLYTKKCRWTIEGIKREAVFKRGEYNDLNVLSILKDEYVSLVDNLEYWK